MSFLLRFRDVLGFINMSNQPATAMDEQGKNNGKEKLTTTSSSSAEAEEKKTTSPSPKRKRTQDNATTSSSSAVPKRKRNQDNATTSSSSVQAENSTSSPSSKRKRNQDNATTSSSSVQAENSTSSAEQTSSSSSSSSSSSQTSQTPAKRKRIKSNKPESEAQKRRRLEKASSIEDSMQFYTKFWKAYDEVVGMCHINGVGKAVEDISLLQASKLVSPSKGGMNFLKKYISDENIEKICTLMGLAVDTADINTQFQECFNDQWQIYQKDSSRDRRYKEMFNTIMTSRMEDKLSAWGKALPLAIFVDLPNIKIGLIPGVFDITRFVRSIAKDGPIDRKVSFIGIFSGRATLSIDSAEKYTADLKAAFPDLENDDVVVHAQVMGENGKEVAVDIAMIAAMRNQADIKPPHKFIICTGDGADEKDGEKGLPTFSADIAARLVKNEYVELLSWDTKLSAAYPCMQEMFPKFMNIRYLDDLRDMCLVPPPPNGLQYSDLSGSGPCHDFQKYNVCSRRPYCKYTHIPSFSFSSSSQEQQFPLNKITRTIRSRVESLVAQVKTNVRGSRVLPEGSDVAEDVRADLVVHDKKLGALAADLNVHDQKLGALGDSVRATSNDVSNLTQALGEAKEEIKALQSKMDAVCKNLSIV